AFWRSSEVQARRKSRKHIIKSVANNRHREAILSLFGQAALSSHPDKVPEIERAAADIQFKTISKAYEILYDDDKRRLYNSHGMSAFEAGNGQGSGDVDLDDILAQMMGMGLGGGKPSGFGGTRSSKPRKGRDEEQDYSVTLEDLYKGKTVKFSSTKNIICTNCKGSGGKDKVKPKPCASCRGSGFKQNLRSVGPGLVTQETVTCGNCKGKGAVFNLKDRCKKCQGECVNKSRKVLELYIPRGSKEGEKIRLEGEADQVPDQQPGDIIFTLAQRQHDVFRRSGTDLCATFEITLAEALCGFSRVVIKHLDGRGIYMEHPQPPARVLEPGQVIKIPGEGMPQKKSEMKGNLYLIVHVNFPDHNWLELNQAITRLKELLPEPGMPLEADIVDKVEYDETADINGFGVGGEDGGVWEDDAEDEGGAQCQQQ
ncbi:MAG: hypothetical protein Q9164_000065, partial [Protoblastenia rupestris]